VVANVKVGILAVLVRLVLLVIVIVMLIWELQILLVMVVFATILTFLVPHVTHVPTLVLQLSLLAKTLLVLGVFVQVAGQEMNVVNVHSLTSA